MTAKSSKLSKDNGWGGLVTDLEWDIYYGNPEQLAKLSAYPVWTPEVFASYAWCWMLLKVELSTDGWRTIYSNVIDQVRFPWWEKVGKPDYIWVNSFSRINLSRVRFAEDTAANDKLQQAAAAHQKLLDEKTYRRNEARCKKLGLTVEQEKFLKEHKHNEVRYYKLEIRRPNYLFKIQKVASLLQQGSKFLQMPDEEFLENFDSISHETRREMSAVLEGNLLGWLDTRLSILKLRKENAVRAKEVNLVMPQTDPPESKP